MTIISIYNKIVVVLNYNNSMNSQIIIGLTSKIAAGKGTIAKYLKEKYQAKSYGFSTPLRDIIKDIKQDDSPLIVLDGVRRLADIKYAKELPNFFLVRVVTNEKNRYTRLIQRQQNTDDQNKTFEQFLEDEQRETELQIPEVMTQADYEINNNGNLAETYQQIDDLMAKLQQKLN